MEELREWVQENRAGLGTVVRLDEPGSLWQPWQYYPELVALLAEVRVTSPVPGQPGLVIAPLGKRVLVGVLDIILSRIMVFPILYVLLTLDVPNWQEQFMKALFEPQSPISQPLLNYSVLSNLIWYALLTFYMAGFHAAHGQTPAKELLHLRVVDQNGKKPPFARALLRGLMLAFSVYLFGIPLAYAFFNPERRTFHDFIAGTYVVEA